MYGSESLNRASSDSGISYDVPRSATHSDGSRSELSFPETPDDVSIWVEQHRKPQYPLSKPELHITGDGDHHIDPAPLDGEFFELECRPVIRVDHTGQPGKHIMAPAPASERRHYGSLPLPRRSDTGTDQDELDLAILRALNEQ